MKTINYVEGFDSSGYPIGNVDSIVAGGPICIHGNLRVEKKNSAKTGKDYLYLTITDNHGSSSGQLIFDTDKRYPFFNDLVGKESEVEICAIGVKNGKYTNVDVQNATLFLKEEETPEEVENKTNQKKENINSLIDAIISPFIRDIVKDVYETDGLMDKVLAVPATEYSGYNYYGGLADLITTTGVMADGFTKVINDDSSYPSSFILNPDLLLAGALLCNVGKAFMLEWNENLSKPMKTQQGILDNEAVLARMMVADSIKKISQSVDDEGNPKYVVRPDVDIELYHMIDSCKEQTNWGAISVPRTKHAMILASICRMAFAKGLFEDLENRNVGGDKFIKAYDNGKFYFLPESYID